MELETNRLIILVKWWKLSYNKSSYFSSQDRETKENRYKEHVTEQWK